MFNPVLSVITCCAHRIYDIVRRAFSATFVIFRSVFAPITVTAWSVFAPITVTAWSVFAPITVIARSALARRSNPLFFILLLVSPFSFAHEGTHKSGPSVPHDMSTYIVTPSHGEVVTNPIKVVFGLKGIGVAPAGVMRENTGHHHLLIDVDEIDVTKSIPADDQHLHFGGGQTETTLNLKPGKHTLQLLLGDGIHKPHAKPVMSEKITIYVK